MVGRACLQVGQDLDHYYYDYHDDHIDHYDHIEMMMMIIMIILKDKKELHSGKEWKALVFSALWWPTLLGESMMKRNDDAIKIIIVIDL